VTGKKHSYGKIITDDDDNNTDKPKHTWWSGRFIYLLFINNAVSRTLYRVSNDRL